MTRTISLMPWMRCNTDETDDRLGVWRAVEQLT